MYQSGRLGIRSERFFDEEEAGEQALVAEKKNKRDWGLLDSVSLV